MSVYWTNCITCDNVHKIDTETLEAMSYICDGSGNSAIRVYVVNSSGTANDRFCGLISDYTPEVRTFDGVNYTGIVIDHNLNKTTGLIIGVTDDQSKPVTISGYILSANSFFMILDGLTDGGFCIE